MRHALPKLQLWSRSRSGVVHLELYRRTSRTFGRRNGILATVYATTACTVWKRRCALKSSITLDNEEAIDEVANVISGSSNPCTSTGAPE